MDFSLSDEQRLLIDTVRRFVREQLAPLEDEVEASGALAPDKATAIHEKGKALGLYGMNIPQEHGGGGLSAVDTMLCEEPFGHTTDILIRPRLRQRLRSAAGLPRRAVRALAAAHGARRASARSRSPSPARGRTPSASAPRPPSTTPATGT